MKIFSTLKASSLQISLQTGYDFNPFFLIAGASAATTLRSGFIVTCLTSRDTSNLDWENLIEEIESFALRRVQKDYSKALFPETCQLSRKLDAILLESFWN